MANASKLVVNGYPFTSYIHEKDDFDEFCDWVHEVRVKAGVEKPKVKDRPPRFKNYMGGSVQGQILWAGKMTASVPNTTKGMIYGITGDSNDDKK